MKEILILTLVAVGLAGCTEDIMADGGEGDVLQQANTNSANDEAVLTAEGWGPLRIGMNAEDVFEAVGGKADPNADSGGDPEYCDEYQPERTPDGLFVMMEEGILTRITLGDNDDIRTDQGLTIGDSADAVRAAYGDRLDAIPHFYIGLPAEYLTVWTNGSPSIDGSLLNPDARGIRYVTGEDRTIEFIQAGGPSIEYVEGCL
jgi:hypothetical protein